MNDEYLKYGFYVRGILKVFTAEEMNDPETIRWIKNTAARMEIPFRQWVKELDDHYRDAPHIWIRWSKRQNAWLEIYLPVVQAFRGPNMAHWFRDFCVEVPDDVTPRLPRREAKIRVWVLGCLLKSMVASEQ